MSQNSQIQIGIPWIGIPAEILFNYQMTQTEKILFGIIFNLSKTSRGCWASNEYLATFLGVGKQTISNSISNLKKHEYIKITITKTKKGNDERRIFIDENYTKKYRSLVEKIHDNLYKKNYKGIKENLYPPIKKIIPNRSIIKVSSDKRFSKENLSVSNETHNGFFQNNKSSNNGSIGDELIEYWNNLSNSEIPKHPTKTSKVRNRIKKYIHQLINGRFDQGKKFKPGFFHDYNIPSKWIARKWTLEEIKEGLDRLALLYIEGYWPQDKKKLPNGLDSLFFNFGAKKCSSWFLNVIKNPPQLIINKPKQDNLKPKSDGKPYLIDGTIGIDEPIIQKTPCDVEVNQL